MDRIVIFLNGKRGLSVLDRIVDTNHRIAAVFVPFGREILGLQDCCDRLGLSITSVDDANSAKFIAELEALNPELGIIAGFSTIFKQQLLSIPRLGTINLHAGRLPNYRGGSPLNWQIVNGEDAAGISVIRIDEGIDTGDILSSTTIPIEPDMTISELHDQANRLFPEILLQAIEGLESGSSLGERQQEGDACYWHQRNEGDGLINWESQSAQEVHNLVRAVTDPYPGAFTFIGEHKVRILGTQLDSNTVKGTPGRVCYIQGVGPYILCRDRAILVTRHECDGVNKNRRLKAGSHLSAAPTPRPTRDGAKSKAIQVRDRILSDRLSLERNQFSLPKSFAATEVLVGTNSQGKVCGALAFCDLPFEREHTGRDSARVTQLSTWLDHHETADALMQDVLEKLQSRGYSFCAARFSDDEIEKVSLFERYDFRVVECLMTLGRELPKNGLELDTDVGIATLDDAKYCGEIASLSFSTDRFHADPKFSDEMADRIKTAWAISNVTGRADKTFIIRDGDEIAGFNACTVEQDTAIIDLIAVHPAYQGRNFGAKLVNAALNYYAGRCSRIAVGTQSRNRPSLALYQSQGFRIEASSFTLHRHFGDYM